MKQRRYIAWFLILVSIIMLTASVLPHHHHREILCLQHDITVCGCQCSGEQHNHDVSHDKHTCNAGCVTKFKTITPEKVQNSVSPDYSFCSLLYTVPDILLLSLRLTERNTIPDTYYLEKTTFYMPAPCQGFACSSLCSCLTDRNDLFISNFVASLLS